MPYPIDNKLVIGISSTVLFNLDIESELHSNQGLESFRDYQHKMADAILKPGVSFNFIKRLLKLNEIFPEESPIEIVVLSKNDPSTVHRVFNSIKHYNLDILRFALLGGKSPIKYIPAFNISLFLSSNYDDIRSAINMGYPAGVVVGCGDSECGDNDNEIRIAFDFDGILADDESEKIYKSSGDFSDFHQYEEDNKNIPHNVGPMQQLYKKFMSIQTMETRKLLDDPTYERIMRLSIVTARCAPAHDRVLTSLDYWGIVPDETFFLGGIDKSRVLKVLKPHIYFDDQMIHVNSALDVSMAVHVPFGIRNEK